MFSFIQKNILMLVAGGFFFASGIGLPWIVESGYPALKTAFINSEIYKELQELKTKLADLIPD